MNSPHNLSISEKFMTSDTSTFQIMSTTRLKIVISSHHSYMHQRFRISQNHHIICRCIHSSNKLDKKSSQLVHEHQKLMSTKRIMHLRITVHKSESVFNSSMLQKEKISSVVQCEYPFNSPIHLNQYQGTS